LASQAAEPITRDDGNPLRRRQYLIIQTVGTHLRGYDEKNNVRAGVACPDEKQCKGE